MNPFIDMYVFVCACVRMSKQHDESQEGHKSCARCIDFVYRFREADRRRLIVKTVGLEQTLVHAATRVIISIIIVGDRDNFTVYYFLDISQIFFWRIPFR